MNLVAPLKDIIMEGIFSVMLFFIGLRAMLSQKDDDMGKRGKRKNKFKTRSVTEQEIEEYMNKTEEKDQEPTPMYKRIKDFDLPPARDAQSKPE